MSQKQYELIKGLLDEGYGKGAAWDFWIHLAEGGWNSLVPSRTVGGRLFGVFFASAQLLLQRQQVIIFLQSKVGNSREEGGGWWGSLLDWIDSVECEVFLMQYAVVHAAWGKPFFMETKGGSLSCLEACPVLCRLLRNLEEWAQDPLGSVLLEARAMPIVRASPLFSMLCRRLEVVFGHMTKYWRSYVSPWLPRGGLDPESNPGILHILSNTPSACFFEESLFGIYKNCMRLMGVTDAPWQVRATALSCANHSVNTTMLDEDE